MSACALLDLGKCLGPCIGAVDQVRYRAAVQRAADVLHGRDGTLHGELVARRDALADEWRFEEAAGVRDQVRALEHILGDQRRLESVAERNVAIVAPSTRPRASEVFLIRAGLLVAQATATTATRPTTMARSLAEAFAGPPPATFTREKVDEMHLLDEWLRRHGDRLTLVPVDPADPDAATAGILAAIRAVAVAASTQLTAKRTRGRAARRPATTDAARQRAATAVAAAEVPIPS
jgi:excinuclease UvrABC nuclease subunit